jgi:hypothetical protein
MDRKQYLVIQIHRYKYLAIQILEQKPTKANM